MKKIVLLTACFALAFAESDDPVYSKEKAESQASTLRWKAACFAGTVLLAIAAGITVIAIDGGSPNHCIPHHHKDIHSHGRHDPNHCSSPKPACAPSRCAPQCCPSPHHSIREAP